MKAEDVVNQLPHLAKDERIELIKKYALFVAEKVREDCADNAVLANSWDDIDYDMDIPTISRSSIMDTEIIIP